MTLSQQAPLVERLNDESAHEGETVAMIMVRWNTERKEAAARITELEQELLRTNLAWDDSSRLRQSALSRAERAEAQCRVLRKALESIRVRSLDFMSVQTASRALSLSGGGGREEKDSLPESPSADAGPYPRSHDEQRSHALAAFAAQVLEALWENYDLDGGQIQDLGLKFGLIKAVDYDPSTHVDVHGVGPEPGDEWFVQEPWLTDLANASQRSDGGRG